MKQPQERDYTQRIDAPESFTLKGEQYEIHPSNVASAGEIGYYSIGSTVILELKGTIHSSAGPTFSEALNALRTEILLNAGD